MKEIELKYGCNPNQKPSKIFMADGRDLPVTVLNGRPGYINFLDALNSYQLVKELESAIGLPAAASFKHVSPAGAAVGLPLSDTLRKIYWVDDDAVLSPLASAYATKDKWLLLLKLIRYWDLISRQCIISGINSVRVFH